MTDAVKIAKTVASLASALRLGVVGGRLLAVVSGKTVVRLVWRHKLAFVVMSLAVVGYAWVGWPGLAALMTAIAVTCLAWRRLHASSFTWMSAWTRGAVRRGLVYRPRWSKIAKACRLSRPGENGETVTPSLTRVKSTRAADELTVRLLPGQAPSDYAAAADDLAHAFGVRSVRVRSPRPGRVVLSLARRDLLASVVSPFQLTPAGAVDFEALPVGRSEHGGTYRLGLLYDHVLVAGATGSGKGSALWSIAAALAPAVPAGLVQLWGCDPKGGIELALGHQLFTRLAVDDEPGDMIGLVADAAELVRARCQRLRGHTRKHTPTTAEPFIALVVDELAFLSEYQDDNKQRATFNRALKVVLSQGRAAGVSVVAFVQDPRKSVVDARNLFPTKIALRLDTASEVEMTLGKDAWERGARCEIIPRAQPGTGYVLVDGDPDPLRVRFSYLTDDDIRRLAATYPAKPPPPPGAPLRPVPEPAAFELTEAVA